MATAVFFHAHPDDEAIASGGTMARAASEGHRVVLVLATRGELGEPVPGVLAEGEELWERRVVEARASAAILGVSRVEFLDYRDSGMIGEPTNDDRRCFWQADVEVAAAQLAKILIEESASVLGIYDDHGGYGHPDHIQVHRVGVRAAELAGVKAVFQMTMNRDQIMAHAKEGNFPGEEGEARNFDDFGSPEAIITHAVDVSAFVAHKRKAMAAHASQIPEDSFFMQMPEEVFGMAFGTEWYIALGVDRAGAPFQDDLFASL